MVTNLRPGWLADDERWRAQLEAMPPAEVEWLERSWQAAGGRPPAVDTSWIRFESEADQVSGVIAAVIVSVVGLVLGGLTLLTLAGVIR